MIRFPIPSALPLLAGALVLSVGLAACSDNRGVSSLKVPTVSAQVVTHDVRFGTDNRLSAADAKALEAFLGGIGVAYGDHLSIDDPASAGAGDRRAAVARVAARFGMLIEDVAVPTGARPASGTVRLVVSRAQATPPACPDWSDAPVMTMTGAMSSNHGCAVNNNLAAMIADPRDLEQGKTYQGPNAKQIGKAIDAYAKKKPTGADPLPSTSVKNK
jgi:pilus assembly protein CpaD